QYPEIKQAQQRITDWVHQANLKQIEMILTTNQFVKLTRFHDITECTWSAQGSESQIDDFWVSKGILLQLTEPMLALAKNITNSDHKLVAKEL
ncbi:41075_t:CDS:2, partial [Gigaspora margarita]